MQSPIEDLLNGAKKYEIRGVPSRKAPGVDIYLACCGLPLVMGKVTFVRCIGPLSGDEWQRMRPLHRVDGPRLYGDQTYAWEVVDPVRFTPPVAYTPKKGVQTWQVID
jgi:hypothetical protein